MLGALIVPILMMAVPIASQVGHEVYDRFDPVIKYWTVNTSHLEGKDLVITGTMIKNRNGVFLPPTIGRDVATGRN